MLRPRWIALALLLPAALGFVATVSFAPVVRQQIAERAARHGATVVVGRVRPVWLGFHAEELQLRFVDAPGLSVTIAAVDVKTSWRGGAQEVAASGAQVVLRGTIAELHAQLQAVLGRSASSESLPTQAGRSLRLESSSLRWQAGDQSLTGSGITLERVLEGWTLAVQQVRLKQGQQQLSLDGLALSTTGRLSALRLASLHALSASADIVLPPAPPSVAPPSLPPSLKPAGPLPLHAVDDTPPSSALLRQVVALKTHAHQLARSGGLLLSPGVPLAVDQVKLTLHRGDDVIHVDPGSLRVLADPALVHISLSPSASGDEGSPLRLQADVPLADDQELLVSVQGGPVTLAMLGLQEHDMGLLDVGKTSIEAGGKVQLSPDGSHVELDLRGKVRGLSAQYARLSADPVRGVDLQLAVKGGADLGGGLLRVDHSEFDIGTVHAELSGSVERSAARVLVRGSYGVPLASCQGLLDAIPAGLAPRLGGMRMGGTFALHGKILFDSANPAAASVDLSVMNECRVTHAPPEVHVARLQRPFRRKVYTPDGQQVEVESGPGTAGWLAFHSISPFMQAAVLTTEDGGFLRHRGFDFEAIRNSIRENLKAGRFARGASTITMQTAKNLYLEREKTLSRKLQEAVLSLYLEQELSKDQILELYLNSIEFGPMIYGISAAAQHYFHTSAGELSLGQCLYLSSILPNPKVQHFGADGRVTAGYMGYLHKLMRIMSKRNLIREDELTEGLEEWVVFGVAHPPRLGGDRAETPAEDPLPPLMDEPGR